MLLLCIRSYLKSILGYKFLILDAIRTRYLYVSKDVSTRGYFSKPKVVREKKGLRNTAVKEINLLSDI